MDPIGEVQRTFGHGSQVEVYGLQDEAKKAGVNVKKCDKATSEQNKCIQIADFIAGATRSYHENDNDTLKILNEKISIARRY